MLHPGDRLTPLSREYCWEAGRSVVIVTASGAVGSVWLTDVRPAALLGAALLGIVIVGGWSQLVNHNPEDAALDATRPLTTRPQIESSTMTSLRVLSRAPLAVAILLGALATWDILGMDADPLLTASTALLFGLTYSRLRRARAVTKWEGRAAARALVAGSATRGKRYRAPLES